MKERERDYPSSKTNIVYQNYMKEEKMSLGHILHEILKEVVLWVTVAVVGYFVVNKILDEIEAFVFE